MRRVRLRRPELTGNRDEQQRLDAAHSDLEQLLDHSDADRRPSAEAWSAREYVDHCVEVAEEILGWVAGPTEGEPHGLSDLAACWRAVAVLAPPLTEAQRAVALHGQYQQSVAVEWLLRHLLHGAEHHVLDLRRGYASLAMADHPEIPLRG